MSVDTYIDVGDRPRINGEFLDISVTPNEAVDPVTVQLRIAKPSGDVETRDFDSGDPDIIGRSDVGNYFADVPASESGLWRYTWQTTEPDIVVQGSFYVRELRA